jgi:hypothetical protein
MRISKFHQLSVSNVRHVTVFTTPAGPAILKSDFNYGLNINNGRHISITFLLILLKEISYAVICWKGGKDKMN